MELCLSLYGSHDKDRIKQQDGLWKEAIDTGQLYMTTVEIEKWDGYFPADQRETNTVTWGSCNDKYAIVTLVGFH